MKFGSDRAWLLLSLVILLLGVGWIWASRISPGETTSGQIPSPRQGFLAPNFTLKDVNGQSIQLSDLRGRPVLVNVWASWCGPCKAEMPALQRLYQDYHAQGLEILGVNSTSQDTQREAVTFVTQNGLTFPILFDSDGVVARLYQVQSLPSSFFIDATGKIQEVVIGGPMSDALLRVRVDQLLSDVGKAISP